MKNTIVILTALHVERDAVLANLKEYEEIRHPDTGTHYYSGHRSINGRDATIIVGCTDQTNINAASETERAINHFKPSHIFYVGVAGGLKDVRVGDIVIGDQVIGYERGKAENEYKPRFQYGNSSYDLEQAATAFAHTNIWKETAQRLLDTNFHPQINTLSGVIASGEKVVADEQTELYKLIKTSLSHALAVEMEGLGFLNTCRAYPQIKSLLVRGISDLVNDKGEIDGKGSQPYASQNAAAFVFGLIDQLSSQQLLPLAERSQKDQLFEIACKLYPRGLEDKGIWQRSGGDLSLVTLHTQGKAQWIEGLRLIEYGGGGDITIKKLLSQMMIDAGHNEIISAMYQSCI